MNILKALKKERESGRIYVTADGEVINHEKLMKLLNKEFCSGVAAGTISDKVSFGAYAEEIKAHMLTVDYIIEGVEGALSDYEGAGETDKESLEDEPFTESL